MPKKPKKFSRRVFDLHESSSQGLAWCKDFLGDMGRFNNYLSQKFRMSVRAIDQKVALAVEVQRLKEADEELNLPTSEEIEAQLEAEPEEPKEITEAELAELLGE